MLEEIGSGHTPGRLLGQLLSVVVLVGCQTTVTAEPGSGSGGGGGGGESGDGGAGGDSSSNVAVGTAGSGEGCSVLGIWDGVSPAYSNVPRSDAAYQFDTDGSWIGGTSGTDPSATTFMNGTYSVAENVLTVAGANMGHPSCDAAWEATYEMTYSADCRQLHLETSTDNCTGARYYLNAGPEGSTLTRR